MRKGLTTLLTVAIALVSAQAMAIAPTIFDIPSPIVGGGTGSSQVTKYVYPDAFDLNSLAADDSTPVDQLKWSYEVVGSKYAINGLATINSSTEDPINPVTTKDINHALATAETKDIDKKPNTVTIRNIRLAPLSGTGATDTTAGIIDQQAVTFWCSDGTAVSSQTVMFYTDNYPWGNNRLQSGSWKFEKADFLTKSWTTVEGPYGDTTTRTMADGRGICFEVGQYNNNFSSMSSPYAFFTLTDNSVYRIRATMNNSQATVGHTPFWDFLIDNYQGAIDANKGYNLYGMDAMFFENEGGANSVIQKQNGTDYTFYWAPAAFQNKLGWRNSTKGSNGAYDPNNSANKDPYLRFRVMDVTNNALLHSEQKFGTLCLQKVFVESIPFTSLQKGNVLYQVGTVGSTVAKAFKNATDTAPGGNIFVKGLIGTQTLIASNGGYVTLTPSTTQAQSKEYTTVQPAVDKKGIDSNGNIVLKDPYTDILDDFPIAWQPNKMLMLEVDLSAPNTAGQDHPWDYMIMSMESATNELMFESYITANKKIATPKMGAAQTYTMFFNTMNETKSPVANFHFLRWRLRFANNPDLNWPGASDKTNVGGVRIHRIEVSEVSVKVTQ